MLFSVIITISYQYILGHASCLELPENIVPTVKTYDWQCNDCKYCYACHDIANEVC